ncbi:hypothetical protein HU200_038745 [Digitaria exilis]|uniref:VQ domain-containing protein n=1 Tax=Digitaria exilis TaxID=1010633 RepID=A0A835BB56_9POAL|nr:hypothetical protein HU200_038745 [Digitaria exilis]
MDAPSGDRSSPRSRQLQGPRPPRLAVSKDSHKVRKPPVAPQRHPQPQQQQIAQHQQYQHQHHQQQARQPVIIYDASPKVIHTKPGDFMALVQRLTGPGSTSSSQQAQFDAAAAAAGTSSDAPPPQPMDFEPREFLLSPTAALSPAARLAAIERSVRPLPPHAAPGPLPYSYGGGAADDDFFLTASASSSAFAVASADLDGFAAAGRPGILSPAALPPAASTGLFSPLPPLDPSCLSWLSELSPFLHSAGTRAEQQQQAASAAPPFAPSPRSNLLLATPTMPSPATVSVLEFLNGGNFFPDL